MSFRTVAIYGCDICGCEIERSLYTQSKQYGEARSTSARSTYTPEGWSSLHLSPSIASSVEVSTSTRKKTKFIQSSQVRYLVCPECALKFVDLVNTIKAGAAPDKIKRRRFNLATAETDMSVDTISDI